MHGYSPHGIALTNTGEYVCLGTNTPCSGMGVIAKVADPKATAGKSYQLVQGKLDLANLDNTAY